MLNLDTEVKEIEKKILNHDAYGKPYKWSPRDFELGAPLGQGKFGRVHVAREKKTGILVAIKALLKSQIQQSRCERQVLREIEIQSHLKWQMQLNIVTNIIRKTLCGTLDYLPPEMIKKEIYDVTVDQWCLGILLYELLVGKPPFESEGQDRTRERILALDMIYPACLLQPSGRNRLSLDGVKTHHWVRKFVKIEPISLC
ncbi:unnamed protein product [Leptidea sinapis]|uniref:Protein kinase domain-containing protein n=1 Tax=Leptidea sinapis TaxID=189913 RepID=A0A5E4PY23_9NEOP|nr:unnamed protein product [Leptidea sinapis]